MSRFWCVFRLQRNVLTNILVPNHQFAFVNPRLLQPSTRRTIAEQERSAWPDQLAPYRGIPMRLLTLAIGLLLATSSLSQQLPCDLVPEQQLPNCRFTTRSNYALHGSVHTFRVVQKDLSTDPRVQTSRATRAPQLFLQEPGGYLAFSRTGGTIASGSVLSSGLPSQITLEKRIVEGPRTFICSGPPADPKASCREEVYAPDGDLTEGFAYDHGKLLAHQTHHREDNGD